MKIFTLLLLLISGSVIAQTYSGPESIEFDYANNRYLISNTTSKVIIARDAAGVKTNFLTGFSNGPYGLEIVGNTLFACDGARVKGYDLTTKAQVMNLNLNASFLNGITHDNSGNLYVTDYTAKKIYRINIAAQTFNLYVTGLAKSPNGIIYDAANSRLVFVNWGTNAPISAINMSDSTVSTLATTTLGNCDGIATDGNGKFYVAAWSTNSVHLFTNNFVGAPTNVWSGLNSPADIFYNTVTDTLACPNSGNSTVVFKYFGTTVGVKENVSDNFNLNVFPNPTSNELNVNFNYSTVTKIELLIVDMLGKESKLVYTGNTIIGNNNIKIDLQNNNLANGSYKLLMKENGKVVGEKGVVVSR